ncbi:MAG TPA: class I SAM-dependent methyltransferase [Candidatus Angelobacter sp.]|jgi:SAM-dependent methyltransferase
MDDADSNLTRSAHAGPADAIPSRSALAHHWREGVRYFGLLRYLRELLSATWLALLELLPSHLKARFGDLDFDWEHSVNTTRSNVSFQTQFITGVMGRPYFASEPWLFEQIMQALPIDFASFTFVDLGAGKGRALLMAADYPFQQIIGVEFMPDLCRAARENIANYPSDRQKCQQIEVSCMDARDFQFPAGPLVVYLFNPFSEPTFAKILENLRLSVEQAPRQVYVAYRFIEFERLLATAGWLEKIAGTEQWVMYKVIHHADTHG